MRLTLGGAITVTATERWLSEVRAGRAFGFGVLVGAAAAQFSYAQLINPAASAVTILVRSLLAAAGAAGSINVRTHNTALTNLSGNGVNLLSGGAAGVGQVRNVNDAATLGTDVVPARALAETLINPVPEWFMELGPGEGILVVPGAVNVFINAAFLWMEI